MRDASTRSGPTSIVLNVANGKPSFETSSLVTLSRMSRERGPQRPSVVHDEVRSTICAEPSSGRWSRNHFRSAIPWAPPVTTRKVSWSTRMIVRSERKPPRGVSTGV